MREAPLRRRRKPSAPNGSRLLEGRQQQLPRRWPLPLMAQSLRTEQLLIAEGMPGEDR